MNLNLGLESLNGSARGAVVPFTPASAIEMQNASETITNLMASLENYYDAARNAMLVKKAVKKYGKTQSIVALIGQEGLAAAQSFSMEGFWQKTKDLLWKIWSKIKEWWGRFWGMFFSIEDRLRNFKSSLSNKTLVANCEFDAPKVEDVVKYSDDAYEAIKKLQTASEKKDPTTRDFDDMLKYLGDRHNVEVSSNHTFATVHHRYTQKSQIEKEAEELIHVFEKHRNSKKDIDRYTDNFLRNIKDLKVGGIIGTSSDGKVSFRQAYSRTDEFGRTDVDAYAGDDASASANDMAVKMIKTCAKVNNQMVSQTLKAATVVGVKLMSNTRTKNV